MNGKSPTLHQNGVIDVFKLLKVHDLNSRSVVFNGEVQSAMDKEIGRKIIKVTGNLSATNYLEIPNTKFSKSLNFSGKNYYIFLKTFQDKKFSFQLTYMINNENLIKFTFKFPLKNMKFTRTNSYNVDIPITIPNDNWTILKFDPVDYINNYLINEYKEFQLIGGITSENTILRSVSFWSTIYLRGIYISNSNFNIMPKEMSVKTNNIEINHLEFINKEELGNILFKQEETQILHEESLMMKESKRSRSNIIEKFDDSLTNIDKKTKDLLKERMSIEDIVKATMKNLEMTNSKVSLNQSDVNLKREETKDELKELNDNQLIKNMENVNREYQDSKKEMIKNIFKRDEVKRRPLLPDPIMHLKFILGYSSSQCPNVKFLNTNNTEKKLLFAQGTTLINYDYDQIKQKFYFGHSKPITNYVIACEGEIMFSSQEGKNAIIRVWRIENSRCVKMLTTPYEKITSMSVSRDNRILCTVGLESYNKELIILWDIQNLEEIKVSIRQSSHFNVNMIKFSPFEQTILVSCGKENIKFWRVKGDHMGGKAVVLNQYARDSHFLCLDYDNPLVCDETNRGRVFIGSNKGCVFQISCSTQELEAIYKIQDSSILCICVNDAFCVTGSLDGYLRVWPIDFKEFLIEARHDSGVCHVDIAYDALDIVCGTLNGSIGLLNIQTKQYKTLLRTPPNKVQSLTHHPNGNYLFTIEDDKSVRVWNVETKSEAFQFLSSKDPPTAIGVPNNQTFACGFMSGLLKIFDLDKTSILYESKSFNTPIKHIKYIQKDTFLITMNTQGHMSIHDCNNNFIQIKLIKIDEPTLNTDISLTLEEDYFATIGPESNCVIVWNSKTFGMKNRIPIQNFFINKICLINKNLLSVVLENCNVQFYSLATYEGVLVKEMNGIHINKVNEFLITKNYKFLITGGEEGMIKIWDSKMIFKPYTSYQQFIGHSSGVTSIVCLEQKSLLVSVSENSGIYFWNFLGDVTFCESEITQELSKFGNLKEMRELVNVNSSNKKTVFSSSNLNVNNIKSSHLEKTYKQEHSNINDKTEKKLRVTFDNSEDKESLQVLSMLPVQHEENFGVDLTYSQSTSNFFNSDAFNMLSLTQDDLANKLLFKPKYLPNKIDNFVIPIPDKNQEKLQKSSQNLISEKLTKKLIIGYSTNSMRNIVINKENQWFAYTVNNKIIIEFLEEVRSHIILEEHLDEISVLILSPDKKSLISASGQINKEEMAPICIWDTQTWKMKKKLNFHYRGVQTIKFSGNGKYMISVGNREEKSICIWNFSNMTVIDSKSLKFPIIDIQTEKNINDSLLYFISISFSVISFWRMDMNYHLEGYHVKYEDLTNDREEGEVLTSLEITPFYESVKTSFVIIGTNNGAVLILDKEKKALLRKYYISKYPITKIIFFKDALICAGENPIIYSWKFNSDSIDHENVFDFLEKEKSKVIFLDSSHIAMDFENSNEGIISTDSGSIFFVSFQNESAIKIATSHRNFINSIESDYNNEYILTSGDDGTVRCWTQDTFDQKFQFMKLNDSKCDLAFINHNDNICAVLYDSQYIRIYKMNTLKSIGKLKIPDENINHFNFIFNYQGMIVTTMQDRVYIFDIQNWDPLSVLFTEISNQFMPKNQFFKSIDSKQISLNRSLVNFSFSDGTNLTISVEKNRGKIETLIVDKFNMFEYHISKSDDVHIAEMYQNLTKFRTNYICSAQFSKKYDDFLFGFHECLQFLFIRDYSRNEVLRRIPLNYFPSSLSVSEDEKYIAVGTKEGLVLFITRLENSLQSAFNLDLFSGHYDLVKFVSFNKDSSKLFSTSHSELIVWNIN